MRTSPRIYINTSLQLGDIIELSREQTHYLTNVMRIVLGSEIIAFNGIDGEFSCRMHEIHKKSCKIECIEQIRPQVQLPEITLFFAPIKGHRNDNIIEKATEIGAKYIIPIITERTIVRKPNIEKYCSTAIEAAEQCEGLNIPIISDAQNLLDALVNFKGDKILFADETGGGKKITEAANSIDKSIGILIGPEGGFSEKEHSQILQISKIIPISLGQRILRADTAAIVSLALLQNSWGDWQ